MQRTTNQNVSVVPDNIFLHKRIYVAKRRITNSSVFPYQSLLSLCFQSSIHVQILAEI